MSFVTPANIAGGVAQGAIQQSQVARSRDARIRQAARQAQALREQSAHDAEAVEDSYETTDDHLHVDEEGRGSGAFADLRQQGEREEAAEESGEAAEPGESANPEDGTGVNGDGLTIHRIDVTA